MALEEFRNSGTWLSKIVGRISEHAGSIRQNKEQIESSSSIIEKERLLSYRENRLSSHQSIEFATCNDSRNRADVRDTRVTYEASVHLESARSSGNEAPWIMAAGLGSTYPCRSPRNVVDDFIEYDPKTDAWTVVATLPKKVLAPVAAIIDNKLIVTTGGYNNPRPLTHETWFTIVAKNQ